MCSGIFQMAFGVPTKMLGFCQCPRPRIKVSTSNPTDMLSIPSYLKPRTLRQANAPRLAQGAESSNITRVVISPERLAELRAARVSTKNRFLADRPPFPTTEVVARERQAWRAANPRREALISAVEEKELEKLDRKRREKYPLHFSGKPKTIFDRFESSVRDSGSIGSASWI